MMYFNSCYHLVMDWFLGLDRQEWLIVLVLGTVLGALCMRGFGSRSSY
jgi:hypothetical protein